MIDYYTLFALLTLHTIMDFFFQSEEMANNKSTSVYWLSLHVCVYSLPFFYWGWAFGVTTFILHWMTDGISSQCTSYYHKRGKTREFFMVIGVDQLIHMASLVFAYEVYIAK